MTSPAASPSSPSRSAGSSARTDVPVSSAKRAAPSAWSGWPWVSRVSATRLPARSAVSMTCAQVALVERAGVDDDGEVGVRLGDDPGVGAVQRHRRRVRRQDAEGARGGGPRDRSAAGLAGEGGCVGHAGVPPEGRAVRGPSRVPGAPVAASRLRDVLGELVVPRPAQHDLAALERGPAPAPASGRGLPRAASAVRRRGVRRERAQRRDGRRHHQQLTAVVAGGRLGRPDPHRAVGLAWRRSRVRWPAGSAATKNQVS